MKTLLKIFAWLLVVIVVLIAGALTFLFVKFPRKEAPSQVKIEATPARLERGKYLVNHVTVCLDCHSDHNVNYYGAPIKPGTEGQGSFFTEDKQLGTVYTPNITPHALSSWSDGEIARTITSGVNKSGTPLFPIMPYLLYANLTQEDLYSIITYLRSLKPITNNPPRTKLNFPMNLIVRTIPQPGHLTYKPGSEHKGEYLVHVAGCIMCHTPKGDKGQAIPGMTFAGGEKFDIPSSPAVHSANITPDMETGIGGWDREFFIKRFKFYDNPDALKIDLNAAKENTVMPWLCYAGMTEEDLGAIYDYLRTVPPVRHSVKKW